MIRKLAISVLVLTILATPLSAGTLSIARAETATTPFQDYGDAPDSNNRAGLSMTAYPGVPARFPTVAQTVEPSGPVHTAVSTRLRYILGYGISAEESADAGADDDGFNNIVPQFDEADRDGRDDGVALPDHLPHCERVQIQVAVTVFDRGQQFPENVFVNLWLDFDRNGQWGEQKTCPNGVVSTEWAVNNHAISLPAPGVHVITLPAFVAWNEQPDDDMWMRVTLAESQAPAADGRGPLGGYSFGETEDYRLESVGSPLPPALLPPLQAGDFTPVTLFKVHLPFVALPQEFNPPEDMPAPGGVLREVDVAHLGGLVNGPTMPLIITVIVTGYAGRLSSWTTSSQVGAPAFLKDGPLLFGHNHRLHVLTPPNTPKLAHETLVSALIQGGTLWLTTWRVLNDGTFQQLDTRGYGKNANVTVNRYAIAHRPLVVNANQKRHQVVTPIVHSGGRLRLVTWEINAISGAISGKNDSGDIEADAAADTDLSVIFAPGEALTGLLVQPHYVVSLRNAAGNLVSYLWNVTVAGAPSLRGSGVSGRNIRNTADIVQTAQNVEIAPLANTGFVAAVNTGNGSLKLLTWENLTTVCPDANSCQYVSSNISDNMLDLNQAGNGIQQPLPTIMTLRALLRDPLYGADLYTKNADTLQSIASLRKVMVTIVALEAVSNGFASLDDAVTVSAAAANVSSSGADSMGLQAGEVISLRNLLYGNMMVSAGDATWAIAEHIGGSVDGMVELMNLKASELGMINTFHCQEGAIFSDVSYSTARDQAILWESVYNDPLFLEFAGADSQEVCGTLPGNVEICHPAIPPMTKNMSRYPRLDGYKTGGNGGLCPSIPMFDTIPTCVGGGCLVVQATRLQRPLIITELQPTGQTANRWADARRLFDYGFRQIFTPDFRASSAGVGGVANDFGLDYLTDSHAVTAALTGDQQMSLCNWTTDTDSSSISKGGCAQRSYIGLPAGQQQTPPTRLDIVRISTLEAEGDYLLGRLEGNKLVLRLWRIGEKDF